MVEDDILILARKADFRRKLGMMALMLGAIGLFGGLIQLLPGDPGDTNRARLYWFSGVGGGLMLGGLWVFLTNRIPAEAKVGRLAMIRAEGLQKKRQAAFLLMPLSLGLMQMAVVRAASHAANGVPLKHYELFVIVCFLGFLITFALLISGRWMDRWARPVLDDELSRQLRAKAMQAGYLTMVVGAAALYALTFVDRALALELTSIVAALGVAGPAVYLALLERKAGREQ